MSDGRRGRQRGRVRRAGALSGAPDVQALERGDLEELVGLLARRRGVAGLLAVAVGARAGSCDGAGVGLDGRVLRAAAEAREVVHHGGGSPRVHVRSLAGGGMCVYGCVWERGSRSGVVEGERAAILRVSGQVRNLSRDGESVSGLRAGSYGGVKGEATRSSRWPWGLCCSFPDGGLLFVPHLKSKNKKKEKKIKRNSDARCDSPYQIAGPFYFFFF